MALPGFGSATQYIEVPLRADDALDMTSDEFSAYLESLDPELLKVKPGKFPILFKMRKTLPYHLYLKLENMKMDMVKKKEGDTITNEMVPKMAWIAEEVRFSLVDIINPPNAAEDERVEFKRDSDGICSPEIMSELIARGAYMDLWSARQASDKKSVKVQKKK
jgi:hypothetical protein